MITSLIIVLLIFSAVLPVTGSNNEKYDIKTEKSSKNINVITHQDMIFNLNPFDCDPTCIIPDPLDDTTTESMVGNLQEALEEYPYYDLSSIDVTIDQTQYQRWDYAEDIVEVSLEFEFIGNEAGHQNVMGYYFDSDENSFVGVFEAPDNHGNNHSGYDLPVATLGDKFTVNNIPISELGQIGFAIDSENGDVYKLFSENDLNPNNKDRALVFTLCDDEYGLIYVICFEDLEYDGHKDFYDCCAILRILECTSCNDPPICSNEEPPDGETDVSIDISELTVTIEDPDNDDIDWTITTNPDIGSASGTGETGGTKTCSISDLEYETTYTWTVTTTDPEGSGETTEKIYTFTTVGSNAPEISYPNPTDGATEIELNQSELSVNIEDPDGDTFDWTIETNPDIGSESGTGETGGTKTCSISDLEYETTYTWTVTATDTGGGGETSEQVYSFTTISSNSPVISDPNPEDGLDGVSISLSQLSVTIEDPENDIMDWTIETSPDIGNNAASCDTSGVKTCYISGLEFNSTYTWFVNATDSGSWITVSEIFTFTTESSDNDRPIIYNPDPPNTETWVPVSTTILSVSIQDPENDPIDWSIETLPDIGSSNGTGEVSGVKTCIISGLEYDTTYKWEIEATDTTGSGKTRRRYYVFTTEPRPPNPPSTPGGPPYLELGKAGLFCTQTSHPTGERIQYRFDWNSEGSHDLSYWTNFVSSGTEVCLEHSWTKPGIYVVKSIARDELGATSIWSGGMTIVIGNHAPEKPETPWTKARSALTATFNTKTIDPDGDHVWYKWDWGDGTSSNWIGPFESGESVSISHTWPDGDKYKIKVKAKDIYDFESVWSDSTSVRNRNFYPRNTHILYLLDHIFNFSPILKLILLVR